MASSIIALQAGALSTAVSVLRDSQVRPAAVNSAPALALPLYRPNSAGTGQPMFAGRPNLCFPGICGFLVVLKGFRVKGLNPRLGISVYFDILSA
jgi:hypothetical protein